MNDVRITIKDGALQIRIDELRDMLVGPERIELIKSLGMEKDVIEWVVDMLVDEVPDYWMGDSPNIIHKLLVRLEKRQLGNLPAWHWAPWDAIRDRLKWNYTERNIYWKMFHDEEHGDLFRSWLQKNGIDSEHTTKLADEYIKTMEGLIRDTFRKMKEETPSPDEA